MHNNKLLYSVTGYFIYINTKYEFISRETVLKLVECQNRCNQQSAEEQNFMYHNITVVPVLN